MIAKVQHRQYFCLKYGFRGVLDLIVSYLNFKGLERQRLIGSAVAGLIHAQTITNAFAKGLDARQDDNNKGICSPGSLANNSVRKDSLYASFPLKGQAVYDFSNLTKWQILFDILQSA